MLSLVCPLLVPVKVTPALIDCFPVCRRTNYLYAFIITDATDGFIYSSGHQSTDHLTLGILSSKPLPHLKVFLTLIKIVYYC